MPLISIILPTYNVEEYISRALESCINQTLKDIEIIVVDDKGQDKSIDIAKEYASRDDRIKIIDNKENLKLFHARINGVRNANSELIMFLDPDDELEFNACEILYDKAIEYKNIDLICFNFKKITKQEIIEENLFNNNYLDIEGFVKYILDSKLCYWNLWNKVFKRELYLKVLEYQIKNIIMAEDALCFFLYVQNCKKIITLNNYFYKYYQNNSSSSTRTNSLMALKQNIQDEIYVINLINSFIIKEDTIKQLRNDIVYKLKSYNNDRVLIYRKIKTPYFGFIYKLIHRIKYKILIKRKINEKSS